MKKAWRGVGWVCIGYALFTAMFTVGVWPVAAVVLLGPKLNEHWIFPLLLALHLFMTIYGFVIMIMEERERGNKI